MYLKKLVIRSFGDIDNEVLVMDRLLNCVSPTVGYAIALVTNNSFAQRHLKEIEINRSTYIYGEIETLAKGVYTVTINGYEPVAYTLNGKTLSDEQLLEDKVLCRPYRDDNVSLFVTDTNEEFLDYLRFLPRYFEKLQPYKEFYKELMYDKYTEVYRSRGYFLGYQGERGYTLNWGYGIKLVRPNDLSAVDELALRYGAFIRLANLVSACRGSRRESIANTPILVDSFLSSLNCDANLRRDLLKYTAKSGRQAFFLEKAPELTKSLIKI